MIDQAKLNALPLNVLQELHERIKYTLTRKARSEVRYGAVMEFYSPKKMRTVQIKVTGSGPKNVTGVELDEMGRETLSRWRVNPTLLRPVASAPTTRATSAF